MASKPALHIAEGADEGLGRPLPVRLSRIERYAGQPRRYFDPRELEELADSIQERGQDTPIQVCRHSEKAGTFVLVDGERRWRAFSIIRERTSTDPIVNCFIDVINDEKHHFRKALGAHLQRVDLIPIDEAAAYQRLYDESSARNHNARLEEIARFVKKSKTHIENYIQMHSLSDRVKALMDMRRDKSVRLTPTSAIDIARSTRDPELQLSLAQEAVERNLGVVETRMLISLKTGKSGYGISGRMRKPSDDYKAFKSFLGYTLNRVRRIREGIDINALYQSRDDERGDRERDAEQLKALMGHLKAFLTQIE